MNKTDRLLAIVLELQAKRMQRAEDLAQTFEVSKRTIYRDIEVLSEAGVPIVAEAGRGYSLVEGYFLPPLRFTADEAVMLLLGCEVMEQSFDAEYRTAAQDAERKIAGVLREDLRRMVQDLHGSIRFITPQLAGMPREVEMLRQIRRAIVQRRTMRFLYTARQNEPDAPALEQRTADPYGLAHVRGSWYVVAYDHTRRSVRHFRVERIDELKLLAETFTRPSDFAVEQGERDQGRTLEVRVLFDLEVARWVREQRSFFTVREEEHSNGLLVTYMVRHERDLLQWLLGWGSHILELEPASLRQLLVAEAQAMAERLQVP